jgi:hypothetical protein
MSEIKVNKITPKQNCTQVTLGDSGDDIVVATGVNLKTAAVKDAAGNVIVSRCGSNITIGSSGASIALACGATQTGFGRTGTVDWDTTAKTASFTAVSGDGYFVNTTSGAITMTLPASPSSGDIVAFKDYANTFDTNNLTIARNGSPIGGETNDAVISVEGQSGTLVYVDGTKGWMIVNASTDADLPAPAYIVATGGTVTCCGDYKIHTFTGPGTFTVSCAGNPAGSTTVDYLVVAGGGGSGAGSSSSNWAGGAGAGGGFRESSGTASGCYTASPLGACVSALPVSVQGYPITVGGGGTGLSACASGQGGDGINSVFSTITSTGGGGGGNRGTPGETPNHYGRDGGSGGGGAGNNIGSYPAGMCAGAGNTPPVSPPQGKDGGKGYWSGGGGGGATVAGSEGAEPVDVPTTLAGGPGGAGATTSISASPTAYAGGGGGGGSAQTGCTPGPIPSATGGTGGAGGAGAGGNGHNLPGNNGNAGTANTGGGAGGAGGGGIVRCSGANGANGGSGIVIIRYKFQ